MPRLGFRKARLGFLASYLLPGAYYLLLASLSYSVLACRPTPTPPPRVHLNIISSDSSQYVARELADAYRRQHPYTTFDFSTTNSAMAMRQMAQHQFDLAIVERNPRADELERADANAVELGRDAVVMIVHPTNPLPDVSLHDLAKVLSGEINLWSALNARLPNGQDAIQVLSREDGSGMRQVLQDSVLRQRRMTLTALLRPTNLDMLDYVSDHPEAIGYVAANIWDENSHTRTLAIGGVPPTRANLTSGTYPLLQSVFLILPKNAGENVTNFIDFIASPDGRQVLNHRLAPIPPK